MKVWLLDAGPLVAYLDPADPYHDPSADALEAFDGQLHTTSAVIVEAMHFLRHYSDGPDSLVKLLMKSRAQVHDCTDLTQLESAAKLMRKYADVPMDFADATLVLLAQELGVADILTLDRRGFSTFRFGGYNRFQLLLGR